MLSFSFLALQVLNEFKYVTLLVFYACVGYTGYIMLVKWVLFLRTKKFRMQLPRNYFASQLKKNYSFKIFIKVS